MVQREYLEDALRQLYVLDAIDIDGTLTACGRAMADLPLDPSLARALIAAREFGCVDAMMTVAAMLSPEGNVFCGGKGPEQVLNDPGALPVDESGRHLLEDMMEDGFGDHILLLRLYRAWEGSGCSVDWCRRIGVDARSMRFARDVRRQLERIFTIAAKDRKKHHDEPLDIHNQGSSDAWSSGDDAIEERESKRRRPHRGSQPGLRKDSLEELRAVRMAVAIGFANRLARRMAMHNGYRTLGATSALAQIHPSSSRLATDADGLLPEWVVYHELVSTGKAYLRGVCSVEGQWVSSVLPKLHGMDVARLSGGSTTCSYRDLPVV